MSTVRIWDLPTRLFHWCFAACVVGAYVSVKTDIMAWHVRFGLAALGLVVFRIVWGFIGPRHARFGTFVRGPGAISAYLRELGAGTAKSAGHNPLGTLSVLAMLVDLGAQAAMGLFITDDVMVQGPFYGKVPEAASDLLAALHKYNQWIFIALVALHLLAVAWYTQARKEPLVRAMVTGDMPMERLPTDTRASEDTAGIRLRALGLAIIVAALVWWIQSPG